MTTTTSGRGGPVPPRPGEEDDVNLYFAYGSNLDAAQMARRCPSARAVCTARLYDCRLAFAGHSPAWGGAVATVVRLPGAHVDGVVYRLSTRDLAALDRIEGAAYRRVRAAVVDAFGCDRSAVTYHMPGAEEAAPSARYLGAIRQAYEELGLDTAPLDQVAVAGGPGPDGDGLARVFVYGTLMRGERNHCFLEGATFCGTAATEPRHRLLDLGAFPAMVAGGRASVAGEIYDVDAGTLAALDRLEGHPGFYRRTAVRLLDGGTAEAYLMPGTKAAGTEIKSGDWRRREEWRCASA